MLAKSEPRALAEVLSDLAARSACFNGGLSPTVLAAVRRQTEAVFGTGLRDELQRPIERAAAEIEESEKETPPIEKHTSMLLEAANKGELRMLSVSLEGKAMA